MKAKRFLILALLLPCLLIGCNQISPEQQTTPVETSSTATHDCTTPEQTTPEEEVVVPTPEVTLTLTHVTITAGETPAEKTAVAELTKYLEKRSITVSEGGYPIQLSLDESLEDDSYRIDAVIEGDTPAMTIRGGNGRGVLYGVYGFLEKIRRLACLHSHP